MSLTKNTTKNRDLSLDFLKGIAIVMVVFFHNIQLNPDSLIDNLFMLAANAAVPCFFLVSGALFFHRPFHMNRHLRRTIRFYLVYVIWRAFYLAFYLFHGAPFDGSLRKLFAYLFLFQTMPGVETGHFWFMDAMLTILFAAPLFHLCWTAHRNQIPYLLGILFLFNQGLTAGNLFFAIVCPMIGKPAPELSFFAEINPFNFRYSNYMVYYLLGAVLLESEKTRLSAKSNDARILSHRTRLSQLLYCRFTALFLVCFGLLGLLIIKYLESGTLLWQGLHVTSGYYRISTILLACGAFLLSRQCSIETHRPLAWFARTVGTSTMGIFYLHMPLIFLLRPSLFAQFTAYNGWLLNLAESLFITAIACTISWIGKKIPVIRHLFQG